MLCKNCNSQITTVSNFCPCCGAELMNPQDVIEQIHITEYKTSRRKLIIRIASVAIFLILGLVKSIIIRDFTMFLMDSAPIAFWASFFVTYMIGDGIRAFFEKIWNAISTAAAIITSGILYGIVILIVLIVFLSILSLIANFIPEWVGNVVFIVLLYSGAILNIIAGIKNYNSMLLHNNN